MESQAMENETFGRSGGAHGLTGLVDLSGFQF